MKKLQADAGEYKDGKEGPLQVRKKDSIRGRLRRTFLLLTILIIMVMCTFSLIFFFYATKRNAENLIRNKIQLAAVFMEAKKDEVSAFARQLTEDRALQIGLDLNNPERISSYLFDIMKQNPGYYITVFSSQGSPLADIGDSSSVVFTNRKSMSISEQILLKEGLKGNAVTDAILVTNGLQEKFPGYVAVRPVRRNNNILGVVLVRFLFPDNTDFFNRLAANLESELAIYVDGEASLKTADLSLVLTVPKNEIPFNSSQLKNVLIKNNQPLIRLLIGAEGGLTDQEIAQAQQIGFQSWQIGNRVLRTETAPVVALASLQAWIV